jgi:restriction endonuclease Mrr
MAVPDLQTLMRPLLAEYALGGEQRIARVVLVDGERLAALMIDHNVGVSDRETYAVKRVDSDYFGDETD